MHYPEGFRQYIPLSWIRGRPPAFPVLERAPQRVDFFEALLNIAFQRRKSAWLCARPLTAEFGTVVIFGAPAALNGSLTLAAHKNALSCTLWLKNAASPHAYTFCLQIA
jgi:hypothetical protein